MNRPGMTDGERKLLLYATELLKGSSDPRVSDRIAKVYRNLLFRSRAHDFDEVQKNIDVLEGIVTKPVPGSEAVQEKGDAAVVAFYALLNHDQVAAFALIDRVGEDYLHAALTEALNSLRNEPVTLHGLWQSATAKLSEATLKSSTVAWVSLARDYCQAMLQANPLAAFSIWLQACEWQQRFPSAAASSILIELAYLIIQPNVQKFSRMNSALWAFVQEQDETRTLTDEVGQAAKISSLLAALEMIKFEISRAELDESTIRETSEKVVLLISEDLPSENRWTVVESAIRVVLAAKPFPGHDSIAAQLESVLQKWTEKHRHEAEESIQPSKEVAPWVDQPLYVADWTEMEIKEDIRNLLWPLALPGCILHGSQSTIDRVRFLKPGFYPELTLLEIQVRLEDGINGICNVLMKDQRQVAALAGNAPPIHSLNARGELQHMDDERVVSEYLRFFCTAVWGEGGGPFRIVENLADIPLFDPPDEASLQKMLETFKEHPLELRRRSKGFWEASALVCYKNTLNQCEFKIPPTGTVEMVADKSLGQLWDVRKIMMRDGFRFYEGIWEEGRPNPESPTPEESK